MRLVFGVFWVHDELTPSPFGRGSSVYDGGGCLAPTALTLLLICRS